MKLAETEGSVVDVCRRTHFRCFIGDYPYLVLRRPPGPDVALFEIGQRLDEEQWRDDWDKVIGVCT